MTLDAIGSVILDEDRSGKELRHALDTFVRLCSEASDIHPDRSFNAWSEDVFLDSGVAINPQAAANCALDYQRSVMFIRGAFAAINALRSRFPSESIRILYAGCGPFATMLLPLMGRFSPGELTLCLLDIHQRSLNSVARLLDRFGLADHAVTLVKADACSYRHAQPLHLVLAETMQKSLEQEPQFAVTANLAAQLVPAGLFIPQRIEVALGLVNPDGLMQHPLATVFTLLAEHAPAQMLEATERGGSNAPELVAVEIDVPRLGGIAELDLALFTRIRVFEQFALNDNETEITLVQKCHDVPALAGGERLRVSYHLGSYPRFGVERCG